MAKGTTRGEDIRKGPGVYLLILLLVLLVAGGLLLVAPARAQERSNCTPDTDQTTLFVEVFGVVTPAGPASVGSVVTAHGTDGTQVGCFVIHA